MRRDLHEYPDALRGRAGPAVGPANGMMGTNEGMDMMTDVKEYRRRVDELEREVRRLRDTLAVVRDMADEWGEMGKDIPRRDLVAALGERP